MISRITSQMQNRNLLAGITQRQQNIYTAQNQVTSGVQFGRPSENPFGASRVLNDTQGIALQQRLRENALTARDFSYAADNELGQAAEVLNRARELTIRAASEALNEQQISGIASEIDGLLERLTDIANTTHEGQFLFGGFQSNDPPFRIEKNLGLEGTGLNLLGLNSGTFRTRLETAALTTALPGSFALQGGDLILNGVDIGAFSALDTLPPSRTAAQNAQTLVDRINAKTAETGITARAVAFPTGTFDTPGAAPLEGIVLTNLDANGQPTQRDIRVEGRGVPGAGGLNLFRRETLSLADTRFTSLQIGAGAIGNVTPPGDAITINGIALTTPMTFLATNTPEQNAQEIARAINTLSSQTAVYAGTDGNGFVTLTSQRPFTVNQVPAQPQLNLPNGTVEQRRDGSTSSAPPTTGTALTLGQGSLLINGVDIFSAPVTLDAAQTPLERADALVRAINSKANDTGITAARDATGQLVFSNGNKRITQVTYQGDSGTRNAAIGRQELLPMNISGDIAFSGNKDAVRLLSSMDIPAAGLGSAVSTAAVSFLGGTSLTAGEFVVNGTDILAGPFAGNAAADATALIAAVNGQSGTTGVSAVSDGANGLRLISNSGLPFTLSTSGDGSRAQIPAPLAGASYLNEIAAGDIFINGVDIGPVPAVPFNSLDPAQNMRDNANALATAINAQAAITGVRAEVTTSDTGGTRLLLQASGQDIEITSNSLNPAAIFQTIGIQPGTRVDQRIDSFEALIRFRALVSNSRYDRDSVETMSQITLKEIDQAVTAMTANRVELGVRGQRAELVEARTQETEALLTRQRSDLQDTDLAKVLSQLTLDETSLQAALAMTQRVNSLSLLDYI
jgi:flagellin-like hook-associated protein FlgL